MPRPSPVTGEPMEEREFLGVLVEVCKSSGGIWLDQGELGRLLREGQDAIADVDVQVQPTPPEGDPPREALTRKCPLCRIPLYRYRYLQTTDIVLDGCEECGGVYVDDGELGAIASFLREREENPAPIRAQVDQILADLSDSRKREWLDNFVRVLNFRRYGR